MAIALDILGKRIGEAGQRASERIGQRSFEKRQEESTLRMAKARAGIDYEYRLKLEKKRQQFTREDIEWGARWTDEMNRYFQSPTVRDLMFDSMNSRDPGILMQYDKTMEAMDKVSRREEVDPNVFAWMGDAAMPIYQKITEDREHREKSTRDKLKFAAELANVKAQTAVYTEQAAKIKKATEEGKPFDVEKYEKSRAKILKDINNVMSNTRYRELRESMPVGGYIKGDDEFDEWGSFQDNLKFMRTMMNNLDRRVLTSLGVDLDAYDKLMEIQKEQERYEESQKAVYDYMDEEEKFNLLRPFKSLSEIIGKLEAPYVQGKRVSQTTKQTEGKEYKVGDKKEVNGIEWEYIGNDEWQKVKK